MKGEILSCPFCGGSGWAIRSNHETLTGLAYSHQYECSGCWARGPLVRLTESAFDAWNRRASIAAKEG